MFSRMVDRISANLAWNKIVRPQHVGYGRISVDDLKPHTATFLESVRHRFDADIKSVNFAGRDRLRIGMGAIRLHLGAFLRVERTMRGTEPAFRDPEIQKYAGLRSLARSSGDCGICSESLTKKSMSLRVEDP